VNRGTEQAPPIRGQNDRVIIAEGRIEHFVAFIGKLDIYWNASRPVMILPEPGFKPGYASAGWYVQKRGSPGTLGQMGGITATEFPGPRLEIVFQLLGFPNPELFWKMVDEVIEKMKRKGFAPQPLPAEDDVRKRRGGRPGLDHIASCFISHSSKDKRFCDRLYADLRAKDVQAYYFPKNARWGETVWGEIGRGIERHDKVVVVCSKNSLQSGPVLREIERALNREDREGKNFLLPIRIDDYLFECWEHPRKADVVSKVVGDFRGWDQSPEKYDAAFRNLLRALEADGSG